MSIDDKIARLLQVDSRLIKPRSIASKREAMIQEAITWKSGTFEVPEYTTYLTNGKYEIKFKKPGKEVFEEKRPNKNDMRPDIFFDGELIHTINAQFRDIFYVLEDEFRDNPKELKLFGTLIFRMAFLLDHVPFGQSWRYKAPSAALDIIAAVKPNLHGVPILTFLQYLDAIALNEDVKYFTLEYDLIRTKVGRINNLLTYVYCITVLTHDVPIADFADKLIKTRGTASMTNKDAFKYFPLLAPEKDSQKD